MHSFRIDGAHIYNNRTRSFSDISLAVSDGRFVPDSSFDAVGGYEGCWIIPGLIDLHSHGRAGENFARTTDVDSYAAMLRSYAMSGTTSIFATIDSAPFEEMVSAAHMAERASRFDEFGASVTGIHFEGRFMNQLRRGAHKAELLRNPDCGELNILLDACGDLPVRITFAPELEGGHDFLRLALRRGARAGIGHSDCSYEQAVEAVNLGASFFCHTFNAMRPFTHREPGTAGAALTTNGYAELICDGIHLHPASVKLAALAKSPDRIILITDSNAAAGKGDGNYVLAGIAVIVKDGKAVNLEGAIAGSTLNLLDGLFNFCKFTNTPLEYTIPCATENPAVSMGLYDKIGSIDLGKRADFVVLAPDRRTPVAVCCAGRLEKIV